MIKIMRKICNRTFSSKESVGCKASTWFAGKYILIFPPQIQISLCFPQLPKTGFIFPQYSQLSSIFLNPLLTIAIMVVWSMKTKMVKILITDLRCSLVSDRSSFPSNPSSSSQFLWVSPNYCNFPRHYHPRHYFDDHCYSRCPCRRHQSIWFSGKIINKPFMDWCSTVVL